MGAIEDCKLVKPKGASWDAPERVARKVVLGAHRRAGVAKFSATRLHQKQHNVSKGV